MPESSTPPAATSGTITVSNRDGLASGGGGGQSLSTSLARGEVLADGSTTHVVTSSDGQTTKSYAEIYGAEIMRVGVWNGNKFTLNDLQDIAAAAPDVGYVPPLKVGHDESIGARAWGWIRNLRVAGEKLIGDLLDIPESLAAIIRERGYDQLSAEVYLDLDRNGKRFRRALKAVALLGAEVPAVSDLKPLRELFADAQSGYWVHGDDAEPIHFVVVPRNHPFSATQPRPSVSPINMKEGGLCPRNICNTL